MTFVFVLVIMLAGGGAADSTLIHLPPGTTEFQCDQMAKEVLNSPGRLFAGCVAVRETGLAG